MANRTPRIMHSRSSWVARRLLNTRGFASGRALGKVTRAEQRCDICEISQNDPGVILQTVRHGVHIEVEQVSSRGSAVADVILSFAADHGADLIVIGAYSHARSVEMVLGGVTRTLLKQACIPILMSQ
jgi:hypothetical protein